MTEKRQLGFERNKAMESDDFVPAPLAPISAEETTAKGRHIMGEGGIEIDTAKVIRTDELDQMAFMRQPVEIHMSDAADESDPQFAEINVNGDYRCLVRGETYTIPRYHVACLARAKSLRIQQKKIVNNDGSMGFVEVPVIKLSYPFAVTNDPDPRGRAWLKQLLQNQV